ncbi:MAG: DUF2953 domain-containing protein [Lachnospiraceae bacterium]|nr:DUF2953 domain-containing protein [Lachnospiraceae bacterium]
MAVFFTILKWVGIVFLALVIALLAILAYCLLLPMGYGIKGSHPPGGKYSVSIRAWGFLRFWQVAMMEIAGEYQLAIFAFWGKLRLYPGRKKKDSPGDNEEMPQNVLDEEDIADILGDREVSLEDLTQESQQVIKDANKEKSPKKTNSKKQISNRVGDFHKKWKDEHNRSAIQFFLKKIVWLIKKTKPNILHADVEFSLGDPALTGLATGVISLCPGCYGKKTSIVPDFESEYIYANGWIEIKGIVFFVHIVYLIVSIFFNKDCRRLMQS